MLNRVMPVSSRVPCQSAKKNVLLLPDRPAERESVLVAAEFRPGSGLGKIVARVQILVAKELEERAVEVVEPDLPITITVPPFDRPYSGE